ncbi:MAG TPA: sulfite exporter TauE/SafE family protein [Marmoricola sp.]
MIGSVWEAVAVFAAGIAAGTINTVVGSGTLITFPTLVAVGVPPVLANVSNSVGLVPGSVSGAWGYRRELEGQRGRLLRLGLASLVGGTVGAILLLVLPGSAFDAIVPVLIALGVVLVIFGPRISSAVSARAAERGGLPEHGAAWVWPSVAGAGVYGGYFGAAQGVLLMAILGIGVDDTMQRHNATKNVLAAIVNGVAAVVFILVSHVAWAAAGLIALGSIIGGQIGAHWGRRLSPLWLRTLIVVIGIAALVQFALRLAG